MNYLFQNDVLYTYGSTMCISVISYEVWCIRYLSWSIGWHNCIEK